MRYAELIAVFDEMCAQEDLTPTPDERAALKRLKELNRERLDAMTDAVHRELRAGLSPSEYERFELEKRLGRFRGL